MGITNFVQWHPPIDTEYWWTDMTHAQLDGSGSLILSEPGAEAIMRPAMIFPQNYSIEAHITIANDAGFALDFFGRVPTFKDVVLSTRKIGQATTFLDLFNGTGFVSGRTPDVGRQWYPGLETGPLLELDGTGTAHGYFQNDSIENGGAFALIHTFDAENNYKGWTRTTATLHIKHPDLSLNLSDDQIFALIKFKGFIEDRVCGMSIFLRKSAGGILSISQQMDDGLSSASFELGAIDFTYTPNAFYKVEITFDEQSVKIKIDDVLVGEFIHERFYIIPEINSVLLSLLDQNFIVNDFKVDSELTFPSFIDLPLQTGFTRRTNLLEPHSYIDHPLPFQEMTQGSDYVLTIFGAGLDDFDIANLFVEINDNAGNFLGNNLVGSTLTDTITFTFDTTAIVRVKPLSINVTTYDLQFALA